MTGGTHATLFAAALALATSTFAQQIDVSTLPPREGVQLTIYNSEDLTLVRDVRHVTVEKGRNELQFSWANTLIDPTSVHFRSRTPGLEVVDTRFPHDRPEVLYWLVDSSFSGEALVEITYFTSGITWSADYVGVTDADERSMRFDGYVTILNDSGETYDNAQIRMVVGEINLVQAIATLASYGIEGEPAGEDVNGGMSKLEMLREALDEKDKAKPSEPAGGFGFGGGGGGGIFGDPGDAPEIVKEGLSDYFIFTVGGTHVVRNESEGRLRLFEGTEVPLATVYRFRPEEYDDEELVKVFLVKNDETNKLGTTPLPNGDVRLYRDRGEGGLSVVAFVDTKYVPIGQEFEFVLGADPEVRWTHVDVATTRGDFWFSRRREEKLFSPTKGDAILAEDRVAGWTTRTSVIERVRNFRDRAIEVEFRVPFDGDVTFESSLSPSLYDFRTVDFKATVPAGATKDLSYVAETREGTNAANERVELRPSPTASPIGPQTPARAP
ncbi:MAG: hypothetical protein JNM94_11530 [Phycisphaerae bacterium]|nr:hypothetical protein [Phycisphaerae bacterium]